MRASILSLLFAAPLAVTATWFKPRAPPPTPFLDPTVRTFVDVLGAGTPIYKLPIPEARAVFETSQEPLPPTTSVDYTIFNITVPNTRPGKVEVHLFKPLNTTESALPTIVYYHGGGWVLGSANSHRRLALDLVERTGYAVFFVQYTPSPESQFPQPIVEAYAAVQYLIKNGAKHGLSTKNFALAGDSAGGGMAISVTIKSIEKKTPLPKVNVLFYPVTDLSRQSETYRTFYNGPGLTVPTLQWMGPLYVPNASDRTNPLVSPLLARNSLLAKFPETLTITAEVDPLRWEGEKFAERLAKNGVKAAVVRVLQTVHDFVLWNALADSPPTLAAIDLAASTIKRVLG